MELLNLRDFEVKKSSERNFGFTFFAFFLFISFWSYHNHKHLGLAATYLGLACLFLSMSLFLPNMLKFLNGIWHNVGLLLSRLVNPIVMAVVYFGLITPIGFFYRLTAKKDLRPEDSLWVRFDKKKTINFDEQF